MFRSIFDHLFCIVKEISYSMHGSVGKEISALAKDCLRTLYSRTNQSTHQIQSIDCMQTLECHRQIVSRVQNVSPQLNSKKEAEFIHLISNSTNLCFHFYVSHAFFGSIPCQLQCLAIVVCDIDATVEKNNSQAGIRPRQRCQSLAVTYTNCVHCIQKIFLQLIPSKESGLGLMM